MTIPEQNTGSTGGLGSCLRTENRRYINYPYGVVRDVRYLERMAGLGQETINRGRQGVTRAVLRILLPETTLHQIVGSPSLSALVEAVVPTHYTEHRRGGDRVWMAMGAINHPLRSPLYPVTQMVREVDAMKKIVHASQNPPVNRIQDLREEGYQFLQTIPSDRLGEMKNLWGRTFQWDDAGIENFSKQIERMRRVRPDQRGLWFSGVVEPRSNALVAVAQGERLDMPIGDGRNIPIVESTEWRRSDSTNRHGLAAAAVSYLNAQILNDLEHQHPLIIAETNYLSGAHNVGFASRMEVPKREFGDRPIHQMLIQNVSVGDDREPVGTRRDFTMEYVSSEEQRTHYNRASRAAMLREGDI